MLHKIVGIAILPFFPIIIILDSMFGEIVTGKKTTLMERIPEEWDAWRTMFWPKR